MRKLKIDLIDLEEGFENSSPEFSYYLDTETGEVLMISSDDRSELRRVLEETGADESIDAALAKQGMDELQQAALRRTWRRQTRA